MGKRIAQKIILIVFVVVICLSKPLSIFLEPFLDSANYENRYMSERPDFSLKNYTSFFREYESYFNDTLQFRNLLVMLNAATDYFGFNISSNDNVVIGPGKWLFYDNAKDGDDFGCYDGSNILREEELNLLVGNVVYEKERLNEMGKEFVVMIVPNKNRVYYDELPARYGLPAENYRALQIVNALRERGVRVVYPLEELMEAKNTFEEEVWYKTDTHWNHIGSYVGSRALLKELGIELPDIYSDEITVTREEPVAMGLSDMLGLSPVLSKHNGDYRYSVSGYPKTDWETYEYDKMSIIRTRAKSADERKLYMIRDSFFDQMIDYIGPQFEEACFRHRLSYVHEDIFNEDPDVVVYEIVERYLDAIGDFSLDHDPPPWEGF